VPASPVGLGRRVAAEAEHQAVTELEVTTDVGTRQERRMDGEQPRGIGQRGAEPEGGPKPGRHHPGHPGELPAPELDGRGSLSALARTARRNASTNRWP